MDSDIITSARRPEELQPIARGAAAPSDPRGRDWRTTLDHLAHTLIRSIASAPPLRRLEAFVDRHLAADDAKQQAAEAAAAAHVLRVRALLTEAEQRMLDDLVQGGAAEPVLATLVRRSEDEALELLRGQLGTIDPVVSAASLARQIGSVRGELTTEEYDRIIMRLPHLSSEEQRTLHAHLRAMTPEDAAMLLRSYLRPVRH